MALGLVFVWLETWCWRSVVDVGGWLIGNMVIGNVLLELLVRWLFGWEWGVFDKCLIVSNIKH